MAQRGSRNDSMRSVRGTDRTPGRTSSRAAATVRRETIGGEEPRRAGTRRRARQPLPEQTPRQSITRTGGKRRPRKPMSPGARRVLIALLVIFMAAVTALVAIFLLFKVNRIQVTGDVIEGYTDEDIVAITGYETGSNLVFLSTDAEERRLMEQVPYIGSAQITRHLPGTVEIKLTASSTVACVQSGEDWLCISETGKILERGETPRRDVLWVIGMEPRASEPGRALEGRDENAVSALLEIVSAAGPALQEWALPGRFVILDLSDISDMRLYYEDKVEFVLGSVLGLSYKVEAGCRFMKDLTAGESGVMDLSTTDETKRAVFTAGAVRLPEVEQAKTDDGPEDADKPADEPSPVATQPPRSEDIPSGIYTGGIVTKSGG